MILSSRAKFKELGGKAESSHCREATAMRLTESPSILPENFAINLPKPGVFHTCRPTRSKR
jgi:hypothetical protein